jgi:pimeloyl-ACP methyl ester carboxylesterase
VGAGAPVLLLCGIGSKRQGYYKQTPVLGRRLRALALDYRDVGDSDPSPGPYSIADVAEDVHALMRELEIDRASLVGISMGGFVALELALRRVISEGKLEALPLTQSVAAVSTGMVDGRALLDLDYSEDSRAEVDFNVVGTDRNTYVEVQGTAEGKPFDRAGMDRLLELADAGLQQLFAAQREILQRA